MLRSQVCERFEKWACVHENVFCSSPKGLFTRASARYQLAVLFLVPSLAFPGRHGKCSGAVHAPRGHQTVPGQRIVKFALEVSRSFFSPQSRSFHFFFLKATCTGSWGVLLSTLADSQTWDVKGRCIMQACNFLHRRTLTCHVSHG